MIQCHDNKILNKDGPVGAKKEKRKIKREAIVKG